MVPPFVATWIPVIVALAFGATILLHQEDGYGRQATRKSIREFVAALVIGAAAVRICHEPGRSLRLQDNNNNGGTGAVASPVKVKVPEGSKLILSSNESV